MKHHVLCMHVCGGQQCWFAHSLRKFAIHDWSFEQKWMTLLLPLLLLYNSKILIICTPYCEQILIIC